MLDEFAQTIDPVALGARHTFPLEYGDVLIVRSGRIDVFVVHSDDSEQPGRRRHLMRLGPGDPVIPVGPPQDDSAWTLVAVGTGETTVQALATERLQRESVDPKVGAFIAPLIERWVSRLTSALATLDPASRPEDPQELAADRTTPVAPQTAVCTSVPVAWVRCSNEHAQFMTETHGPHATADRLLPLSEHGWLYTDDVCSFTVVEHSEALGARAVWNGLNHFHALARHRLQHIIAALLRQEEDRFHDRTERRRALLETAFNKLASVLGTGATSRPAVERDDAHFAAGQLVAADLGFDLERVSDLQSDAYARAPLQCIARASGIQTRKVALRAAWWTKDNGPLYASIEEDGRPVALLPSSPRNYELHDPTQGTVTPVDAEVAETLHPFGYTLYRPLPRRPLSAWDVVRFGLDASSNDLLMIVLMAAAGGLLSMATPIVTGMIFDNVIPGAERGQLLQLTAALLVSAVVAATFRFTQSLAVLRVQGKAFAATQSAVWDRLLGLPLSFFRLYSSGDLAMRAMGLTQIQRLFTGPIIVSIFGGVFSVFNFGLLFYYSSELAWWAALLAALSLVTAGVGNAVQLYYQRRIIRITNAISSLVLQFLTGISKLRIAGAEANAFSIWAGLFSENRRLQYKARQVQNGLLVFNRVYPLFVALVIFGLAVPIVMGSDALSTGGLLAFLAALTAFLTAMTSMSQALSQAFYAIPTYENVRPILREVPEVDASKAKPGTLDGNIEIQHVSFRYDADAPLVIDDLSLQIQAEEFVAIVGPSGSGKSTLFKLLVGFEHPENGAIYYDNQDLDGLDVRAVRRQIGVVVQNGKLMPGDIYENIAGASLITLDDAWQAAELAELADDIRSMPMGMHTVVSENGSTLSGGQIQRLMIARAVVTKPRILFFDEATSALDNKTQAQISRSLERLQATRIAIAHRLSTIRNADRILVVDAGRIVEHGSYDALMDQDGVFADLARRQLT